MEQQIHFCTTADKVRISYATVGNGPPFVKAANWLSHLEFDWSTSLPVELQSILTRALQKSRSERYQTVKDLLADFRTLKQERDFRERLQSST